METDNEVPALSNEVLPNEVLPNEVLPENEVLIDNTAQKSIDKLTLELLVNKGQYRKYLEKTDPAEYKKKQENYDRYTKYRTRIRSLMTELLNDYSVSGNSPHLGNSDIQHIFEAFIQKSIYYFETKEFDSRACEDADIDADVLFGEIDAPATSLPSTFSAPFANHYRPGKSFWGKNIKKSDK